MKLIPPCIALCRDVLRQRMNILEALAKHTPSRNDKRRIETNTAGEMSYEGQYICKNGKNMS